MRIKQASEASQEESGQRRDIKVDLLAGILGKTRQEKGWKCRETTKPVQETKTMKKIEDQKQKAQKLQNDKKKKSTLVIMFMYKI